MCILQHRINLAIVATPDRLFAVVPQDRSTRVPCYDITFDQASSYHDFVMSYNRRICIQCTGPSPVVMIPGLVLRIPAISLDTNTQIIGDAIFEGKKIVNEKDFPIVFQCEARS